VILLSAERLPLELPTATTRIEPFQCWLFREAVGAEPSYDSVHEGHGYVACAAGSAISLSALLVMAGCRPVDGPMLIGSSVELLGELRVDVDYSVTARILGLEHRHGQKLGRFDVLEHEWALVDCDGVTVYRYVGRLALPRPGVA
jgi:hypothetical protein